MVAKTIPLTNEEIAFLLVRVEHNLPEIASNTFRFRS
jgi:hypothetical protein